MRRTLSRQILATLVALALSACASFGINYLHPQGPRCASLGQGQREIPEEGAETFTLISFNVKFGERPEQASQALARAGFDIVDILLLQEVDLRSAVIVAESLDYSYVYYPAAIHPATERQFGLAVLSPWPIRDDRVAGVWRRRAKDRRGRDSLAQRSAGRRREHASAIRPDAGEDRRPASGDHRVCLYLHLSACRRADARRPPILCARWRPEHAHQRQPAGCRCGSRVVGSLESARHRAHLPTAPIRIRPYLRESRPRGDGIWHPHRDWRHRERPPANLRGLRLRRTTA